MSTLPKAEKNELTDKQYQGEGSGFSLIGAFDPLLKEKDEMPSGGLYV